MTLPLRLVSETSKTITLAWDPVPGAQGFVFDVNGARVSSTLDGSRTQVKFGKVPNGIYGVRALITGVSGVYPAPPVPIPVPPATALPKHGLSFGINFPNQPGQFMPDVLSLGSPVVRFQWWGSGCDQAVQQCLDRGVSVILVVMTGADSTVIDAAKAQADAERCAITWANHVGANGAAVLGYVFLNEVDLTSTWTPELYADALVGHCAGVHLRHPKALAIGGGFFNGGAVGSAATWWNRIVKRWKSQGLPIPCDAVDEHTYGRAVWGDGSPEANARNTYWQTFRLDPCIRSILDDNGGSHIPIILGECGDKLENTDQAGQAAAVKDAFDHVASGEAVLAMPYSARDDLAGRFGIMGRLAETAYRTAAKSL